MTSQDVSDALTHATVVLYPMCSVSSTIGRCAFIGEAPQQWLTQHPLGQGPASNTPQLAGTCMLHKGTCKAPEPLLCSVPARVITRCISAPETSM
jgi:hypothetical protein